MVRSQTQEPAPFTDRLGREIPKGENILSLFCHPRAIERAMSAFTSPVNQRTDIGPGGNRMAPRERLKAILRTSRRRKVDASPRRTALEVMPKGIRIVNSSRHDRLKSATPPFINQHFRVSKTSATGKTTSPVKMTYGKRRPFQVSLRPDARDLVYDSGSSKSQGLMTDSESRRESQSEEALPPEQDFTQSSFTHEDPDRTFLQPEILDDLERELLGEFNSQTLTPSAPIQKLQSPSPERYDVQRFDDADEDKLETYLTKKQRTSRTIPKVEARNAALQDLRSQKTSKVARDACNGPRGSIPKKSCSTKEAVSKKKKKPRRLPVNELITVSDKFEVSDIDTPDIIPAELSDDPVSQPAENIDRSRKTFAVRLKGTTKQSLRKINITHFRLPERRQEYREHRSSPSYCDGFEGQEAAPLKLYMPIKRATRPREARDKVLIRFPTLTIVAKKASSDGIEVVQKRRRNKSKQPPEGHNSQQSMSKKINRRSSIRNESNPVASNHQESQNKVEELLAEKATTTRNKKKDTRQFSSDDESSDHVYLETDGNQDHQETAETHESGLAMKQDIHTPRSALSANKFPKTPVTNSSCIDQGPNLGQAKRQASLAIHKVRDCTSSQILSTSRPSQYYRSGSAQLRKSKNRLDQIRVSQELAAVSVPRKSTADNDQSDQESRSEHSSTERYLGSENDDESDADSDDNGLKTEEIEEEESQWNLEVPEKIRNDCEHSRNGEPTDVSNNHPEIALQQIAHHALGIRFSSQSWLSMPRPVQSFHAGYSPGNLALQKAAAEEPFMMPVSEVSQQQYQSSMQHYEDPDSSWRPRVPDTEGLSIEIDNDKIENSIPLLSHSGASCRPRRSSRQRSGITIWPLTLVMERPMASLVDTMPTEQYSSRGSPILGESQDTIPKRQRSPILGQSQSSASLPQSRIIPETQFEEDTGLLTPAATVALEESYFTSASRQLSQPFRNMPASRTKSSPAPRSFLEQESQPPLLPMSQMSRNTISSPIKTSHREPSMHQSTSQKDLSTLTRQSSMRMGTMPASLRKRSVIPPLLSLMPPFKKLEGSSRRSSGGKSAR